MIRLPAVVDTNVVVAGLLTGDRDAPTRRILDAMLAGRLPFLLSVDLLAEYRAVLLRPAIRRRHGLHDDEIDSTLTRLAANAIVREPGTSGRDAPDSGDRHLWALLRTTPGAVLVTGDALLRRRPPSRASALSPAAFVRLAAFGG
jgi:uncharacterized protein